MRGPETKPTVHLMVEGDKTYIQMGRVKRALRAAGADQEYITRYLQESMAGRANNLLQVALKYVNIQ